MLQSVEGIYRGGKVELLEPVSGNAGARVIVTFLSPASVDLAEQGIDEQQTADLRRRLSAFASDWVRPKLDHAGGV